ncbi:MAG: DNA-directed RNA polymerase subunit N [Nanoarchaeota archaeon]|jgi:DNA-directed RNA polymerase subunit N (RpoN/RPB10)|nr:DNA-directed RNA polymerase subunit N [Nanoarchaeota archaeon]|tara:strand:- start:35983 stop:36180 length:198 start_codon:yes stop_codon:yes gene_type:complete
MIIPIRCFGCGKPVAHLQTQYKEELKKSKSPKEILDKLGLERYCCRSLFLSHIDLLETVAKFKKS